MRNQRKGRRPLGRGMVVGVAAGLSMLLLALPAGAQADNVPADAPTTRQTVREAQDQVRRIVRQIRGNWSTRDEVIEAQRRLEEAAIDYKAERRRVVMRLRQENPEYTELRDVIFQKREALSRLRQRRPQRPPAQDAVQRSDGSVIGRLGGEGRQRARILGENTNPRTAGLPLRERMELEAMIHDREPVPPPASQAPPKEIEAAVELLAYQEQLDNLENAAVADDVDASEAKEAYDAAAEAWHDLQEELEEQIVNDPEYKAARDALSAAREGAADAK